MKKYKVYWFERVSSYCYVDANSKREAREKAENGHGYDYEEIDFWDEEIDFIEKA